MDATVRGPLPRPDDEVQDQGLGFDLASMMGRRRLLQVLELGGVAAGLAACGSPSTGTAPSTSSGAPTSGTTVTDASAVLTEIPAETAGPYPGDGSNGPDVLNQNGVVRRDLRSSFAGSSGTAEGVPMTVTDLADGNAPLAGVAVYVWHCDREGRHSMYSEGVNDENYLRGVQVADASGRVTFTSIYPACYAGRWPHIHFEVHSDRASITDASTAIAACQVALPQAASDAVYATAGYEQSVGNLARVSLADDNVFGDDGGVHELGTVTGTVSAGYVVTLAVPVDRATTPGTGSAPGGPGGPGGPSS